MFSRCFAVFVICACLFTRFYKLNWGDGYYFQPDENNMATAISQFSATNLNPHFFAYGQFPLYLGYFSLNLMHLPNSFENSILILRTYSAFFSVLSVFVIYLLMKTLIGRPSVFWLTLLFIFNPGLIQSSHFGTTESLLILIFLTSLYFSFKIVSRPSLYLVIFAAYVNGVGLASKMSALIFIYPIALALLISLIKTKRLLKTIGLAFAYCVVTLSVGVILSPYNLLALSDFLSSMNYETGVATGRTIVFYTSQFINTRPYLFQIFHIFPYTAGLPVFIASFFGLLTVFKKVQTRLLWFILLSSVLIYFLYFGQLYVKWTRFMSPIFFTFPLLVALFTAKIKSKFLQIIIVVVCCLPGVMFLNIYLQPDIRVNASSWIGQHLPPGSVVLSEAGNVLNLPFSSNDLIVNNFDFYNLDSNPLLPQQLLGAVNDSQYIFVPSRRIFKNQNNDLFPYSEAYYRSLFNGQLGFKEIKTFYPLSDLLLNPENAEETWSVFDHPTIRIYRKATQQDKIQYEQILKI